MTSVAELGDRSARCQYDWQNRKTCVILPQNPLAAEGAQSKGSVAVGRCPIDAAPVPLGTQHMSQKKVAEITVPRKIPAADGQRSGDSPGG